MHVACSEMQTSLLLLPVAPFRRCFLPASPCVLPSPCRLTLWVFVPPQMLHLYMWRPSNVEAEGIPLPEGTGAKEVFLAFNEQNPDEVLSRNDLVRKSMHGSSEIPW